MADDDFEKADKDAGAVSIPQVMSPQKQTGGMVSRMPLDIMAYRSKLVEQYHKGAPSLVEKLRQMGKGDQESLLLALIDEVVTETDNLLGNELIATQNGEMRDSSVISYKRAEVIEKAIEALQNKQRLEKQEGVDVDSPSMMIVFRFFMTKAKDTFDRMNVGQEVSDLFFRTMGDGMDNWKKELRDSFEEMRNSR